MKKILILYATAGIGHKKAAVAVKKALDELAPKGVEVAIADALDYTNDFFKWAYLKAYLLAVNKLSRLWGFMYWFTDNFYVNLLVSKARRLNNWLNSKKLVKYLLDSKPDVVLTTHFFASEVIGDLKKKGIFTSRLITVVTDYRLHSWWISPYVDKYVVSNNDARDDLVRWGIERSRIEVMGIPAEPIFSKRLDKESIQGRFGLKKGIFTILVIGGGFGVGPIEEIVKAIGGVSKPLQVIVVCGHNEELIKKMESLKSILDIDIKVLGFVDNVYDYMEVSDILISKSGGITVTESLIKDLPMIVISPIPGQETHNSDFLLRYGAALEVDNPPDLKNILEDLIANPEKIRKMKRVIESIKKPMACYAIARLAVEMCK